MRLINADKLKRKCQKTATEAWKMKIKASIETTLNQFIDWIDQAEPVDAVPVVRCKDCKFYYQMTPETGICELACRHLGNDGFCSEGERKDGEHHEG